MRPVSPTCILTYSGVYVEPLDLDPASIRIEDVAHSLAAQARYTGHTRRPYSVAEHSVRCTLALEAEEHGLDVLRWCLMHDASEAYLVDIPRPLKQDTYFGKAYRGAEARAMAAVCARFGLDPRTPPAVADIDVRLLATERRDLLPATPGWRWSVLDGVEPLPDTIEPWTFAKAERRFLSVFYRLFSEEETT
jgi:hypothetical protein